MTPPPVTEAIARTPRDQSAVLLVEDNPDDVLLVRRAFRKADLASPLHVVGDGEQAVDYLRGHDRFANRQAHPLPGLVLLDMKLPRRSGLEVLAWIRAQAHFVGLPVVMLTSSDAEEDVAAAYQAGASSYVLKPVEFEALRRVVGQLHLYWLLLNVRPGGPASRGGT